MVFFLFFTLLFISQPLASGRCTGIVTPAGYSYTSSGHYINTIQFHSPFWNRSGTLPFSLNTARESYICQALSGTLLLVSGGETQESEAMSSTELVDLHTGTVSEGPSMNVARRWAGHAMVDGVVYVCGGGENREEKLAIDSCEFYKDNQWSLMSSRMVTARVGPSMVYTNSKLIVLGGTAQDKTLLSSVEGYSFESNSWSLLAPMSTERSSFGAAVLDGWVYACGGSNDRQSLDSCEKYSVRENKWKSDVGNLNVKRGVVNMVNFGDKLYMLGGLGEDYTDLKSIEVYDKGENRWKLQGEIDTACGYTYSVAVIDC